MIFITKSLYKKHLEMAGQKAMVELLQQLCEERIVVHEQHTRLKECSSFQIDLDDRAMIESFVCSVMQLKLRFPWWQFWL